MNALQKLGRRDLKNLLTPTYSCVLVHLSDLTSVEQLSASMNDNILTVHVFRQVLVCDLSYSVWLHPSRLLIEVFFGDAWLSRNWNPWHERHASLRIFEQPWRGAFDTMHKGRGKQRVVTCMEADT
jgi:hypothetical protein